MNRARGLAARVIAVLQRLRVLRAARVLVLAAALTAVPGCQAPTSPTQALSGQFGLLPGNYTLTFYVPKGEAGKNVICVDENQVPDTASIPVTVVLADNVYRVTPVGDANIRFQLLLEMSGPTTVYGPVLGQARDPATGVVVTVSPPVDPMYPTSGDAMLSGLMASRTFVAGVVYGSVQFSLDGAARWCQPNNWYLKAR
jgi:hypothetical protein